MKPIFKNTILLLALSSLLYSCPEAIEVVITKNKIQVSDDFEGVWTFEGDEYDDSVVLEIKKKDDYWAFVRIINNEKDEEVALDLTIHNFKGNTLGCLSGWFNGKYGGIVFYINSIKNNTLKLGSIIITSDQERRTFNDVSIDKREASFESYIRNGKIAIDKSDQVILRKKYELLKN